MVETAHVSADPDRLEGFFFAGARERAPFVDDLEGLQASRQRVVEACNDKRVETDALAKLAELLAAMRENEYVAWHIADVLRRDDTCPPSPVGSGMVSAPAATVDARLLEVGVDGGPEIIEVEPAEFRGLPPTSGYVDDPVCAANGNFVHADHDLAFPGFASVLDVVRFYNSLGSDRAGLFGRGWSCLLDMTLTGEVDRGLVRVRLGDGAVVPFVRQRDGRWRLSGRRRLRLTETDGEWVLDAGRERSWRFDRNGRLVGGEVDGARFSVVRHVDRIEVVEPGSGRSVSFRLNRSGRVGCVVASDGRRATYGYDDDGNCIGVHRPRGDLSYEIADGFLAAIHDADGVLICRNTYDGAGRVETQLSAHGRSTRYEYRPAGGLRVVDDHTGEVNAFVHDDRGNLRSIIDGSGSTMRLRYDRLDRPVRITDRTGAVTTYTYHGDDDADLLIGRTDPDGLGCRWSYDDHGRLLSHADRSGAIHRFRYADGEASGPDLVTGPEGAAVHADYDHRGLPTAVTDGDGVTTRFVWDLDGELAAVVDGLDRPTVFIRNRVGLLVRVTDPAERSVSFDHDDRGRLAAVHRADGSSEHYTYSPAGRVLRCVTDGPGAWAASYGSHGEAVTFTDAVGATTRFEHDRRGHLAAVTAPDGGRYRYEHSPTGQVLAAIDPAGHRTEQALDAEDRPIGITLADGRRAWRRLDELGRTVAMTGFDGLTVRRTYHPNGQVASHVDPDGARSTTEVDRLGRITAVVDPSGRRTSYHYTPGGRLAAICSPAGRRWTCRYDRSGRLIEVTDPDHRTTRASGLDPPPAPDLPGSPRFDHDPRGLLRSATDPAGLATSVSRDLRGRVTGLTTGDRSATARYDDAGDLAATVDPLGRATGYEHTPSGRVLTIDHGGGLGTRFRYDEGGRPSAVGGLFGEPLVELHYDRAGRVATLTTQRGAWGIDRDASGRVTGIESPFGTTVLDRDADGLVTTRRDPLGSVRYRRSPAGRLLGFEVETLGLVTVPDRARRSVDGDGRITVDEHGRTHRYDRAGRLESTVTRSGQRYRFGYDDYGLLARERTPSGERVFGYDRAARLIETVDPERGRTTFSYDSAGRRIAERRPSGAIVRYRWTNLDQLIAITTVDRDGTAQHRSIEYGPAGRPELIDRRTVITWDDGMSGKPIGIGSTRYLRSGDRTRIAIDGAAWTDNTVDDPWGHDPDGTGVRIGYRGELAIDGLVFMGARVYDPATRSFLSPDPLPPVAGQNAFVSPYAYAWCDPVNLVDPSGEQPIGLDAYREIREREEGSRFGRAWQAVSDDPWGSVALAGLVVVGSVLLFTPLAPVGAGILIGAAAGAAVGVATDSFDPRAVAVSGVIGGVSGGVGGGLGGTAAGVGTSIGLAAAGGGVESVALQVVVDGSAWDEIDWGRVALDATIGGVTAGAGDTIATRLRARARAPRPAPTIDPSNAANYPRLVRQLRQEEAASVFDYTGALAESAFAKSKLILEGESLANRAVARSLVSDGGTIAHWAKYSTTTFDSPSGPFQVHFYFNQSSGVPSYEFDYKVVFNRGIGR